MRRDLAWPALGVVLVAAARLLSPSVPALYDGITLPTEPFHYCAPPANLASSNKQPGSGAGDLQAPGGQSELGSINTSDNQLLTFFPKGALQAAGATKYHLDLRPDCTPPDPPSHNTLVGDAYGVVVLGQPGDLPVKFLQPAQVLMRTPPVRYTSVQLNYDGQWHSTQWGQQQDIANITINHSGIVALLDDGRVTNPAGKPPSQRPAGIVTVVEVVLVSAALGIVIAAILVQKRRGRVENKVAYGVAKGPAEARKQRSRKRR